MEEQEEEEQQVVVGAAALLKTYTHGPDPGTDIFIDIISVSLPDH